MVEDSKFISEELRAAIAVAKQRVEVEPYYQLALNRGLKGHASGFWSGTFMGLVSGAGIGTMLSLALPSAILGTLAGLPVVAVVAAIGASTGGLIGSRVGIAAVTAAGVMQEKERREKAAVLEKEILASPDKQREVLAAYRKNPLVAQDDNVEQIVTTSKSKSEIFFKIFRPKSYMLAIPLCALAGALLLGASAAPLLATVAVGDSVAIFGGLMVKSIAQAAVVGGALGAGLGAAFGTYYPAIFASIQRRFGEVLSGAMYDKVTGNAPAAAKAPAQQPLIATTSGVGPTRNRMVDTAAANIHYEGVVAPDISTRRLY